MTLHRTSRYTLALALLALPSVVRAQAFGLNEIGSCALSRGFAATSAPCDDGSAIYWNPGAVQKKSGLTISGGAAVIKIDGGFIQDTTYREWKGDVPTAVVPHLFINYRGAGSKMAFGVGAYVPYGLTSQWPDDFPGRFSAKKASLQTIYVQPNLSYQLTDKWSIGGGPVIGHSTVELIQALDLSTQFANATTRFSSLGIARHTEFGRATLKGSAMAYGFDVGLHGTMNERWQMGLRLLSQLSFDYSDAEATFASTPTGLTLAAQNPLGLPAGTPVDAVVAGQFTGAGSLVTQGVQTQIRHPAQVQVGFTYSGFQNTTLSAEYSYVGWKSFNQLPVNFQGAAKANSRVLQEDYNNTSGIRLGAERRLMSGAALRAGFTANTSAAPPETVTPLLPEQDRSVGTLGASIPAMGAFGLDLAYGHVFTPGSRGRLDERAAGSTQAQAIALNSGSYALAANIFAVTLKYGF